MPDQIRNNAIQYSLLLLFIFGYGLGARDNWRKVLWENGINALTHTEDPYRTLLSITNEIETEEDVSLEWALNDIFTKLIALNQSKKIQEFNKQLLPAVSNANLYKPAEENNKSQETKKKPVVSNFNQMKPLDEKMKVEDTPVQTEYPAKKVEQNAANGASPKVDTVKSAETGKIALQKNIFTDTPLPKNEIEAADKPLGLFKLNNNFPMFRKLIGDESNEEEGDPTTAFFPKNLVPKILSLAEESANHPKIPERKVSDAGSQQISANLLKLRPNEESVAKNDATNSGIVKSAEVGKDSQLTNVHANSPALKNEVLGKPLGFIKKGSNFPILRAMMDAEDDDEVEDDSGSVLFSKNIIPKILSFGELGRPSQNMVERKVSEASEPSGFNLLRPSPPEKFATFRNLKQWAGKF